MFSSIERYELKFMIPEKLVAPISDFISIYCSIDKHAINIPGNYYTINNLYFDTKDFLFLRRKLEMVENRFNIRVRSYGNSYLGPYFLEVKQKKIDLVKKYRATVYDKKWYKMFTVPDYDIDEIKTEDTENRDLFFKLAYTFHASPKILTQTKRKAYMSDVDDYCRVTFDKDLQYQPEESYNLVPDPSKLMSYEYSHLVDPINTIVLEIKCYPDKVPPWVIDLIKTFDLQRRGFSKYSLGIFQILGLDYKDMLNLAPNRSAFL